jgi:hypothetical protein
MKKLDLLYFGIGVLTTSIKGENQMAKEELAVQTEKVAKAKEKSIWCQESDIVFFGTELVSEKLINLLRAILKSEDEHGINVIRFTQDLPKTAVTDEQGDLTGKYKNALAAYDFESRAVIVNIGCHFETAMDRILNETKMMRVGAYIHINMVISVLHELFHSHALMDADNPYTVDHKSIDDKCENLAKELVVEYARTVNIEPPALTEESPIVAEFIKEFEDSCVGCDETWAVAYRELLEKNLVYKTEDEEISTLRLYYKRFAQGGGDADNWPEEVHTVTAESFAATPASVTAPVISDGSPSAPITVDGETLLAPDFSEGEIPENIPGIDATAPIVDMTQPLTAPAGAAPAVDTGSPIVGIPAPIGLPAGAPAVAPAVNTPTLPVHALAPEQKLAFIKALCLRMYDYLFGSCGYTHNPQAIQTEPHIGFTQPQAVFGFVPVEDIPFAKEILVGVRTIDEKTGQEIEVDIWNPQVAGWPAGHIRGIVWSKGKYTTQCPLPGYVIRLNLDGVASKRSFVPQNPNKRYTDGNISKWAQEARIGFMRALLLDDQRDKDNKIQISVTTTPDGAHLREVVSNPLNSFRRIL